MYFETEKAQVKAAFELMKLNPELDPETLITLLQEKKLDEEKVKELSEQKKER